MIDGLATGLIVASLVIAGWGLVTTALGRRTDVYQLAGLAAVELALLAQVVIAVVRIVGGDRPDAVVTFVAYLVGSLLVLPAGAAWSIAERSRWGPAVLVAACLVLAVVVVRLQQIWGPAGG